MKHRFLLMLMGLSSFCISIVGCDETVKDTIIDGLQTGATDVATALITALFLSISNGLGVTATMIDSASMLGALLR